MKCPLCDGKGEYMHQCGNYRPCEHCNGTGKVDITNEEWFCSLPIEEKAKTIICLAVNSMHKKRKGLIENDVNEIMRWLKEKHDGK